MYVNLPVHLCINLYHQRFDVSFSVHAYVSLGDFCYVIVSTLGHLRETKHGWSFSCTIIWRIDFLSHYMINTSTNYARFIHIK